MDAHTPSSPALLFEKTSFPFSRSSKLKSPPNLEPHTPSPPPRLGNFASIFASLPAPRVKSPPSAAPILSRVPSSSKSGAVPRPSWSRLSNAAISSDDWHRSASVPVPPPCHSQPPTSPKRQSQDFLSEDSDNFPSSLSSSTSSSSSSSSPSSKAFHSSRSRSRATVDKKATGATPSTTPPSPSTKEAGGSTSLVHLRYTAREVLTPQPDVRFRRLERELVWERADDARVLSAHPKLGKNVHVFVDLSNIVISFRHTIEAIADREGRRNDQTGIFFAYDCLHALLSRNRPLATKVCSASRPPGSALPVYAQDARRLGYKVNEHERVSRSFRARGGTERVKHTEVAVDEVLQLDMSVTLLEHRPAVMVLATGDANVGEFSKGFRYFAELALKKGWAVELVSWTCSLNTLWTDDSWLRQWGDRFRIIALDKYLQYMIATEPKKKE